MCCFGKGIDYFNPRSREGSDQRDKRKREKHKHFNPRSREGSDRDCKTEEVKMDISIHAPAKGATATWWSVFRRRQFQSTLPRRERRHPNRGKSAAICDFNPRSREGSDSIPRPAPAHPSISIHAPAKGATAIVRLYLRTQEFQSTLPRRERHYVFLFVI